MTENDTCSRFLPHRCQKGAKSLYNSSKVVTISKMSIVYLRLFFVAKERVNFFVGEILLMLKFDTQKQPDRVSQIAKEKRRR